MLGETENAVLLMKPTIKKEEKKALLLLPLYCQSISRVQKTPRMQI